MNLTAAVRAASPGDTIVVPAGSYAPQSIDTPGLKLIGEPGAVIDGNGLWPWCLMIRAPHVSVAGFTVRGAVRGAAIHIRDTHHVTVCGCTVCDVEGTGIFATHSDYLTIDNNRVLRCTSPRPTSAISIFQPIPAPGGDLFFRIRVTRNRIRGNGNANTTDGFAFIYDNNPPLVYPHRILVEGNTFSDNAKGMLIYNCARFVLRGNDGRHNGPVEYRFRNSRGVAENNRAEPGPGGVAYDIIRGRVISRSNLVLGGAALNNDDDPLFRKVSGGPLERSDDGGKTWVEIQE